MWLLYLLASTLFHRPRNPILIPQRLFGEVTSPLFPKPCPNSFETNTVITVPTGYRVKLVFQHFDLEPSEGCSYDYVEVGAGRAAEGRQNGTLWDLGSVWHAHPQTHAGITGLSHCAQPGGYFCSCRPGYELQKDRYSCQVECSSELYTEASGYISSLEYPRSYPADLRCNYSIRVEWGLTPHLKFVEPFEIDDHQQVHCPYDQLQNIGEFCGKQSSLGASLNGQQWGKVIKCPQPKTLDEFTVIQNLQPQYQFRDYFIATCKLGYQLIEGNQVLHSFTAVCQDDGTWHRAMPRCNTPKSAFHYTTTMGVNTYKACIQYYCHEPYYKMQTRAGSRESEQTQGIWKNEQKEGKISRCLPVCGKPMNPMEQRQRIIRGQKAKMGNFPWQVFTNIHGNRGGTLLGDCWILTAAHTLYPKEHDAQSNVPLDVFLGHINVEELMKLASHPIRRVSIHPDYRQDESHNFEGDIALLELENSVTLGPNLLPICLPDNETFYDLGLMGYISGFGVMEEKIAHDLRFVRLPVANREDCETWLRGKNRMDVFSQNMFCAGHPSLKQDACQGDSGGVFLWVSSPPGIPFL
uniref:Uncharacterized protein n=1 Tax=Mandrillus leucophaeus TaxID=9568 RepID=A0A2K5ZW12_MANLE